MLYLIHQLISCPGHNAANPQLGELIEPFVESHRVGVGGERSLLRKKKKEGKTTTA